MRPPDWLCALQVRVAREDEVHLLLCAIDRRLDERLHVPDELGDLVTQPEAHVGDDLVVPASARVQLAADRAHELGQSALVGGVDVLIACLGLKGARLPLLVDEPEPVLERLDLLGLEQPRAPERARVGNAALDVLSPHALVVGQRRVELLHERIRLAAEAPAPAQAEADRRDRGNARGAHSARGRGRRRGGTARCPGRQGPTANGGERHSPQRRERALCEAGRDARHAPTDSHETSCSSCT